MMERRRAHDHAQDHGRGHAHAPGHGVDAHAREASRRTLVFVLVITGAFMLAELAGGILSNSLALLADAAHMFTDVGALALSLFALWFAQRPATDEKTFGYLRLEILAALLNGATLIVLSFFIFVEAAARFRDPVEIRGVLMLAVAGGGLLVNVVAATMLHRSAGESLNVRGAYLHVLGDLLGSVGAMTAAAIILLTGWTTADALMSVLVGVLILISSWKLVRESVDILLEAVPGHLDLNEIHTAMREIPGVSEVHDLHVWTVTSGYFAMSGHAVVDEPERTQAVLDAIRQRMHDRFGIEHVTVQVEQRPMYQIRGGE
ncbi:MAG TPA: cation diffusion facilitator family transporter [Longimicrobiales bacterium]|nr:cation diffusion facilitator family transporter [Longimicrobiales bacterium]